MFTVERCLSATCLLRRPHEHIGWANGLLLQCRLTRPVEEIHTVFGLCCGACEGAAGGHGTQTLDFDAASCGAGLRGHEIVTASTCGGQPYPGGSKVLWMVKVKHEPWGTITMLGVVPRCPADSSHPGPVISTPIFCNLVHLWRSCHTEKGGQQ